MLRRLIGLAPGLLALSLAACAAAPAAPAPSPPAQSAVEQSAPRASAPTAAPAAPAAAGAPSTAAKSAPRAADAARSAAAGPASASVAESQPLPPPAPTVVPGPPGEPELPIVQSLDRMIIYTTELTILARNLDAIPTQIADVVIPEGGYVAGIEVREEAGIPTTVVRVKVPPEKHETVVRALRGLALEVRDQKSTTQDVTDEYSDLQLQIASLEATHAQLLQLMQRSGSVEELLKVQQQAGQVKLQIDRLKGRSNVLQRLSDYATITVRAQLASVALQRDYVAARAALRRAEATRAALELQLKNARTPVDEASIRDRLGEVLLEIERVKARIADLEAKAKAIDLTLPAPDQTTGVVPPDEELPKQYLEVRVALRRAQHEQEELTRALQAGRTDVDPAKLQEAILRVHQLSAQLKVIQERAAQTGIALPTLTAEQEAALAGIGQPRPAWELPAPIRAAWEASLSFLLGVGSALVFLWWVVLLVPVVWLLRGRLRPAIARLAPGRRVGGAPQPEP